MRLISQHETRAKLHDRFGKLTVIGSPFVLRDWTTKRTVYQVVVCRCDCGQVTAVRVCNLVKESKGTLSCGCHRRLVSSTKSVKHGLVTKGNPLARLYQIWWNMNRRCNDVKHWCYKNYGARGITVCREWNDVSAFAKWALASGYDHNLTIDRIDPDGDYCPENCQWLEKGENSKKQRQDVLNKLSRLEAENRVLRAKIAELESLLDPCFA